MKHILSVFALAILCIQCRSNKEVTFTDFQGEQLVLDGIDCKMYTSEDAIDSQIGRIQCDGVTFGYDYGRFSDKGPITAREEFRRSFDSYHHIKFFEDRMIDSKVYKLFLDSVRVLDVRRKTLEDELLFSCDPCNAVGIVTFKRDTFNYPFTLSEKQLTMKGFSAQIYEEGPYVYKIYTVDGEKPALAVEPIFNRFGKKNRLSIKTIDASISDEEVKVLLKKIRLKNSKT